ncbi:LysR family transcriptional regulator [Eggerthella timonensis]|uniref:LysR family transcriptional regulator n=1 Tax=Eggerthella timonensis TaxID=1871008 RepID=UPI000C777B01|nr:LysR family transcriptional regulator [Eggerthella timonensis]
MRQTLNVNQLEYYVATVQHGSYAKAAQVLYLTPQAISKAVNDLEKELNVVLMTKAGRSVRPTAFGLTFCEKANRILYSLTELKLSAQDARVEKPLTSSISLAISISPHRGSAIHPEDFDEFKLRNPGISLITRCNSSGVCLNAVEEGVFDGAIILGPANKPDMNSIKVFGVEPVIVVDKSHRLASRESIVLSDLAEEYIALPNDFRYCLSIITDKLENAGFLPNYVELPPFTKGHEDFLGIHCGAMFAMDDNYVRGLYPNAKFIPLSKSATFEIPVYFVHRADNQNPLLSSLAYYISSLAR